MAEGVKTLPRRKRGPRKASEPELVGQKDAAAILGVRPTNLRTVAGLPEPYDHISSGTLWRRDEIEELADQRSGKRIAA
jgi:hypothetical protein